MKYANLCSARMRARIYTRDGRVCQYCGGVDAPVYHVEHVIPRIMGGPAQPYNLVVACRPCNLRKGRRVWIPRNLDSITQQYPAWRARVLASTEHPPRPAVSSKALPRATPAAPPLIALRRAAPAETAAALRGIIWELQAALESITTGQAHGWPLDTGYLRTQLQSSGAELHALTQRL